MKKLLIFIFILILAFSFSCEESQIEIENSIVPDLSSNEDMMILGKQLDNPYSIANMTIALENLKKSGSADGIEFTIEANHLYIRFLPKNGEELNWFINDTTMELFDYPLDYEISKGGIYYHDPSIPEGQPTWLYTTIPIDFEIPPYKYEILEECFIPEEVDSKLKNSSLNSFNRLLEREAFKITGNLDVELKEVSSTMASQIPEGTFRVHNTAEGGLSGIEGVKVRVNTIIKWDSDMTDVGGNYVMTKSFSASPYYSIIYENKRGFKIWADRAFLAPTKYEMGYQSKYGHSKDFWQDSQGWPWAIVNNAVYDYIDYCVLYKINKPPSDMRVWVDKRNDNYFQGAAPMLRRVHGMYNLVSPTQGAAFFATFGVSLSGTVLSNLFSFAQPDLWISANPTSSIYMSRYITELVYHEASHASHYTQAGNNYWVKYINHIIQNFGYGDGPYDGLNAWICGIGEIWGNYHGSYFLSKKRYNLSGLMWDPNEDWYHPGFLMDVENISDITIEEIFDCLTGDVTHIDDLVEELKTKTSYDEKIDDAYDKYF